VVVALFVLNCTRICVFDSALFSSLFERMHTKKKKTVGGMLVRLIIDRETHCYGHKMSYKRKSICVPIRKFSKKEPQGYQLWFLTVSPGIDLDLFWGSSENGHTCVDVQGSPPFWLQDFLQKKHNTCSNILIHQERITPLSIVSCSIGLNLLCAGREDAHA
jgi:hypothetical protein